MVKESQDSQRGASPNRKAVLETVHEELWHSRETRQAPFRDVRLVGVSRKALPHRC